MLANEMKKGTEVIQHSGWYAKIMDNKKGMVRLAEVHGFFTEIGSIYIDDIDMIKTKDGWEKIEFSPAQQKQIDKKNKAYKAIGW